MLMASMCETVFATAMFDMKPIPHTNGFRLCKAAILGFAGLSFDWKPLAMANGFHVWSDLYYTVF